MSEKRHILIRHVDNNVLHVIGEGTLEKCVSEIISDMYHLQEGEEYSIVQIVKNYKVGLRVIEQK